MSNDIKNILDKLTLLEGTVTSPALPKKGLNKQQKGVPQMPALFKPKGISVLNNKKPYPKHPAQGYFVGGESVEPNTNEDMISAVKKGLHDYLQSLEQEMRPDRTLLNKAKQAIEEPPLDRLVPIKTIRTHDGKDIRIHGNEEDGFIIKIKERPLASKFDSLDEAEMACEMYCQRRRQQETIEQNKDYLDEV